jgi:hypothetical protein
MSTRVAFSFLVHEQMSKVASTGAVQKTQEQELQSCLQDKAEPVLRFPPDAHPAQILRTQ